MNPQQPTIPAAPEYFLVAVRFISQGALGNAVWAQAAGVFPVVWPAAFFVQIDLRKQGAMIKAGRVKVAWNVAVRAVGAGKIQDRRLDWIGITVGLL